MIGLMLYAYGAPKSSDELPEYFQHLFNEESVPDAAVANVGRKYRELGTVDPLGAQSVRIADGLESILSERFPEGIKVYNAYKHTTPFASDALQHMLSDGVTTIVTMTLYSIYTPSVTGAFQREVEKCLGNAPGIKLIHMDSWHTSPELISVYSDRVKRAYRWIPTHIRTDSYVLYTVHSHRMTTKGNDIYVKQFREMANAISEQANIPKWRTVYRSAGQTGEWLTPDVKDEMKRLAAAGAKGFVTCELLTLVADIESYYEIGPDCQIVAEELKAEFVRAEFPGDSFDTVKALATIVEKRLKM